ncbi:tektin-B1 [Anabrus simplex]|uniref:tektin-B1 n=1 Tax=Anabrus simplex TaxID=316456 RepID=UPI0034DD333E
MAFTTVTTYEKPSEHVALPDWYSRLYELRQTADNKSRDAYNLRHEGRQLRNETDIKGKWDTYHNNVRLEDRVTEVTRWRDVLQQCLNSVDDEIRKLTEEKSTTERTLEYLNSPLSVIAESLAMRDARSGADLVQDEGDIEIKNELGVIEALKQMLTAKCQTAWEQLNRLKEAQFKLQLDLGNKQDAIDIDRQNLEMDKNCSGTSYKPDPLRIPKNCTPYESWLEHSRYNKLLADNEIAASIKLREAMYVVRERAYNDLKAQNDATDYALRLRVYETQRAKNELEWQRKKMAEEMAKVMREIEDLEEAHLNKTDGLKLAETRLENRIFRPGPELVQDEAQIGLADEVLQLRQTRQDLMDKINAAKATYNGLEELLLRMDSDLDNKNHAMMTDLRCIDIRKRLGMSDRAPPPTQTDVNIQLTRMEDEIPKS